MGSKLKCRTGKLMSHCTLLSPEQRMARLTVKQLKDDEERLKCKKDKFI